MTTIAPLNNQLNQLIKSELYRTIINQISEKYANMDGFINNLNSDITDISSLVDQLDRDADRGYDVGTSLDTLGFQKDTLQLDRDFFVGQKNTYLRKIYQDLYKYTSGIVDKCIEIEDNPRNLEDIELRGGKLSGSRAFDENDTTATYVMSDVFSLLSVTERNLFELAADIATFDSKITEAENKEKRGFSIGNMVLNLKEQESSLKLSFQSYCARLEQFLKENYKFASKCVKRIEVISGEIVTEEELEESTEAESTAEETTE